MKIKLLILSLFFWAGSFAQSVPNTHTFSLLDVISVTGGTSLSTAFGLSVDAYFDALYKGSKDRQSNFRNYIMGTLYYSAAIDSMVRKNNCTGDDHGTLVHIEIAAGSYASYGNQETANQLAKDQAQTQANNSGSCDANFWNTEQTCDVSRDDCGTGYHGSETFQGVVAANTIVSWESVDAANADAQAQCYAVTQQYARENSDCVADECTIGSSFDNTTACTFTSISISIDCSGAFSASMNNDGNCGWGGQVDIYDASNNYITTEYPSWSYSSGKWTASTTLSTSLSNGYSIVIYITN